MFCIRYILGFFGFLGFLGFLVCHTFACSPSAKVNLPHFSMRRSLFSLGLLSAFAVPALTFAASGSTVPAVSRLQDRVLGRLNAQVSMIEYADYECPFCKRHHSVMMSVLRQYRRKANWVFRHYPLTSIHPNAQSASIAAECAGRVGGRTAFWQYSEALMSTSTLSQKSYEAQATKLGIDLARFRTCQADSSIATRIATQSEGGKAAGVAGTPTVFLVAKDGRTKMVAGAVTEQTLKDAIDELLAEKAAE